MTNKKFWTLFGLAALLRLPGVFIGYYWYDEAFTALAAMLPADRWYQYLAGDVHPPLWYLITWPFARLAGVDSEWALRLPAYMFSLVALWLLWRIVQRMAWPGGQYAIVAMAVLPFWLFYAAEGRMYALLVSCALLAFYGLVADDDLAWFVGLCGLLWSHNYGMFYAAVLVVCMLLWRYRFGFFVLSIGAGALFVANWLIPVTLAQMLTLSGGYWIQPLTAGQLMQNIFYLVVGFTVPAPLLAVTMVLSFAALTWLLLYGVQHWRQAPAGWPLVLALALGVGLLAQGISLVYRPVFLFRALIGSVPFVLLLAGWAIQLAPRPARLLLGAGMALVAAIGLGRFWFDNAKLEAEWFVTGLEQVRSEWQPGDTMLHAGASTLVAWQTYARDIPQYRATPCGDWDAYGGLSNQTIQAIGVPEMDIEQARQGRVWLAVGLGPLSHPCIKPAILDMLQRAEPVAVQFNNEYSISGIWLYTPGNEPTGETFDQQSKPCER